jgi:hypothetical protein
VSNDKDISPLAAYIAKKDHLYQRLIFVPSTVLPTYPHCVDKHLPEYQSRVKRNIDVFGDLFNGEPKRLAPMEELEANIQTYLSEAVHFIKLYLYEATCKSKLSSNQPWTASLPRCTSSTPWRLA